MEPKKPLPYITVLAIAGSDSCAGAGIQADIKSCAAAGVYAMTAITAVTAQNTCGVTSFEAVTPALLRAQIEAAVQDARPQAVKIGMVPDARSIKVIANAIKAMGLAPVVLDPVLVATAGSDLTDGHTTGAMLSELLPLAALVTPNLPEAEALSGVAIRDDASLRLAAEKLLALTPGAILIKGGHGVNMDARQVTDALFLPGGAEPVRFTHPRIISPNTHGTGCSLSSAIAARLALGMTLTDACREAVEWLAGAIAAGASRSLGHGHGPVDHFYSHNLYK